MAYAPSARLDYVVGSRGNCITPASDGKRGSGAMDTGSQDGTDTTRLKSLLLTQRYH